MFNKKYGIMFNFNPTMQCILGKFFGWMLVLEAHNESHAYNGTDKIEFNYNNPSQFNKLVKFIQAKNKEV